MSDHWRSNLSFLVPAAVWTDGAARVIPSAAHPSEGVMVFAGDTVDMLFKWQVLSITWEFLQDCQKSCGKRPHEAGWGKAKSMQSCSQGRSFSLVKFKKRKQKKPKWQSKCVTVTEWTYTVRCVRKYSVKRCFFIMQDWVSCWVLHKQLHPSAALLCAVKIKVEK